MDEANIPKLSKASRRRFNVLMTVATGAVFTKTVTRGKHKGENRAVIPDFYGIMEQNGKGEMANQISSSIDKVDKKSRNAR
jgi:hypothetical protein